MELSQNLETRAQKMREEIPEGYYEPGWNLGSVIKFIEQTDLDKLTADELRWMLNTIRGLYDD